MRRRSTVARYQPGQFRFAQVFIPLCTPTAMAPQNVVHLARVTDDRFELRVDAARLHDNLGDGACELHTNTE